MEQEQIDQMSYQDRVILAQRLIEGLHGNVAQEFVLQATRALLTNLNFVYSDN